MVVMGAPGDYQQERLRRVVETRRADAVVLAGRGARTTASTISPGRLPVRHARPQPVGRPILSLRSTSISRRRARRGRPPGLARPSPDRRHPPLADLNFGYLFLSGYRKALKRHGIDLIPS